MEETIWDYLEELERRRKPIVQQRERVQLSSPPVQPQPAFNPFVEDETDYGFGRIMPAETLSTRPRIVPNAAAENRVALAPMDELSIAENNLKTLRNTSPVNNDKGFLGLLGDILRQAVVSGGDAYKMGVQSGMRPDQALAQGVGGLFTGGLYGGFHPEVDEERQQLYDIGQGEKDVERIKLNQAFQSQIASQEAARENLKRDDARREEEFRQMQDWRNRETVRKETDRISREKTSRMNAVKDILKTIPSYDPADERFAELTKALGDVNLPITPKDAKKNVRLVQDQRDGLWTVVLTDTVSGKQEVRPVMTKDNKQLATTPTVVMQGEYGLIKQNDQQEWQGQQNAEQRKIERERLAQQQSQFLQNYEQKVKQDTQSMAQDKQKMDLYKAQEIRKLNEAKNAVPPKIDDDTYNKMMEILSR